MKWAEKLYLRCMIKSPLLFFSMLILVIASFILLAMTTEIDIVQTYDGSFSGNRIILNEILSEPAEIVYVYKNRGERILKLSITEMDSEDEQYTILYFDEKADTEYYDGKIKLDVVKEQSTLLRIMLGIDQKIIPEDYHV